MKPSGIIVAHNVYRSAQPSGENVAVERTVAMLAAAGVRLHHCERRSDDLLRAGALRQLITAWRLAGHGPRRARLRDELTPLATPGTVMHLHNPWPLLTYDVALAAHDLGIPVVQTLHNHRLIATNDRIVREGRLQKPRSAADHLHIRRLASMHDGMASELVYRRALKRLWRQHIPQTAVDRYICVSDRQRGLMMEAGLPPERLVTIPNFAEDPGEVGTGPGDFALFVGRLDTVKGIDWLTQHWSATGLPLRVVGDGPLTGHLPTNPNITYLGRREPHEVRALMAQARFLVMASRCYEGHPLVLIEAAATGTPALVPNLGSLPQLAGPGIGEAYAPENAGELVRVAQQLWQSAPGRRLACRKHYEEHYTPAIHRRSLLSLLGSLAGASR